jgi:hypothetical protein
MRVKFKGNDMNYGDRPLTIPPEEDGTPQTGRTIRAITEAGLPPLHGAEADIAVATEIRLEKLMAADDLLTLLRSDEQETELGHMAGAKPETPVSPDDVRAAQVALNRLRHQEEATWWLAHRDHAARELLAMFTE